jgi:hypothetical protein
MSTPARRTAEILILDMAQPLFFQPSELEAVFVIRISTTMGGMVEANLTILRDVKTLHLSKYSAPHPKTVSMMTRENAQLKL